MLPLFTNPLAFWGLLALPALVAIYWLRNRFRRQPVSSLMLWTEPMDAPTGGTRIDRLRTPLLFYLELIALTLLVLAAADPQVPLGRGARPLVVVLDDSFSMHAGGEQSARLQAARALEEELRNHPRYSVRFVLAGETPQALGDPAHSTAEAVERLRDWHCRAPAAHIDEALSLASEIGGELALLLVLTDHPPPDDLGKGRVRWWSFGEARPNVAFVNAARTPQGDAERCLLEIVNFSAEPRDTDLVVETGEPAALGRRGAAGAAELQRTALRLAPHETRRVILQLKEGTPALRARIGEDALDVDNEVILLPVAARPVRVDVRIRDKVLREPLERALRATRSAVPGADRPEVVFTDRPEAPEDVGDAWVVHVLAEKDAVAYSGPFVIDRNHPLTEGLSLQGVVWGAGRARQSAGAPVILAGNVPLLSDADSAARDGVGGHDIRLRLRPDLSTLQDSPAWPVLVWNLLQWRASANPGLSRPNVRLGGETALTFAVSPGEPVPVVSPDGSTHTLPVPDRRLVVRADQAGVYEIRSAEGPVYFASNALAADESDLAACAPGRWGDWLDETTLRLEYQGIAWALLLVALAVVSLHLFLVARGKGRSNL
jgi:hypothetical protein